MTLPGDPLDPVGRLHLITATRREIEDVFLGLGYDVAEGPEVETVHYNFDALNHLPTHPARARSDTFYVSDQVVLRTHTSPMQVRAMEAQPPPLYIVVPGRTYRRDADATHTPQFHQVEGLAVDEDITLADLHGTLLAFARAIFGPERRVRMRPHFFPFTEPSVEVDVSCFRCTGGALKDGSRCPLCKGEGWIEVLGAGMVDPAVFELRARARLRPRARAGVRVRGGDRADRDAQAPRPRPAPVLRQRRALPGAVRMRVPLRWLHEYCRPGLDAAELADRLDMTGTKVERVVRHGVGDADRLRRRAGAGGRRASRRRSPDGVPGGGGDGEVARIVCGAPNVAAGQTVAVARPGAVMPDGTRLEAARLRGVESQGMILAEDELGIGVEHAGILVLDDGDLAPGTPLAEVLAIADEVLELEVTPNRPDCLGVYGVARELHAASGAPLAPPPWARGSRPAGSGRRAWRSWSRSPTCAHASRPGASRT